MRSPVIRFDQINVNVIESCSGIFIGTNSQYDWDANSKTNSGFGSVSGDHVSVHHNVNTLYDDDIIDTPIHDKNITTQGYSAV